ncbi:MAG: FecR domain-containing protein [Chitinophagales bacterium]|nr:FecR domain-containing protein [Chitinophagales bacterium]
MNSKHNHIDEGLLVKQLLGEATEAEQAAVQAWIEADEANRKHYEQFRRVWNDSKLLAAKSTVDENEAWTRFQQRVKAEEQPATKTIPLSGNKFNWMRVAASLVFLIGFGWLTYYTFMGSTTTYIAQGTVTTETLPDGTVVTLNAGASVTFDSKFSGNTRDVKLEGEAFFDVTPNKKKPFIITTDNASIKVVGTSFNVKSSEKITEVIVETGIVEVSKKKAMVKLTPGEKTTVLQNSEKLVKEKVDDVLYNYYRTKELVCKNTPLWRLVNVLNDAYDVQITIGDPSLKDRPITTTFKNEPIESILDVISQSLNVTIEKEGKYITIK